MRISDWSSDVCSSDLLDTPIVSRWAAIVLRRALLSRVPTASGVRPADWIAERALLLTRMGDVEAARMLEQAVPVDRFTPRLYAVAEIGRASCRERVCQYV